MLNTAYRQVTAQDISSLAKIRAKNWGSEAYWNDRISGYLNGTVNPQKALEPRIIYVAYKDHEIAGFIAGHLTQRFECDGELEWIDVVEEYRNAGIASALVQILARWFIQHNCFTICVDPGNEIARQFYKKNGAESLNEHWLFWKDIRMILQ